MQLQGIRRTVGGLRSYGQGGHIPDAGYYAEPTDSNVHTQLAAIAAIASFAGAALMLLVSLLGFAHLRRVAP